VSAEYGTREQLADFAPMAQRVVTIDDGALIRFRSAEDHIAGFVRLPYDVLAGRTVAAEPSAIFDVTISAVDLLSWLEQDTPQPQRRDAHWLSALPPRSGWQRVEVLPDVTIRDVVRSGARLARSTQTKQGQQSLLSSIVLTASSSGRTVDVPLGALSGLTKLGFLPHDSSAAIDVAPGWIRIAAPYGSTFVSGHLDPLGMLVIG
jgi:hypothetical protein